MCALYANTKKHLDALARGRDLAEIFPWTGEASGKGCAVSCFDFQGHLNPLQLEWSLFLTL